MGLNRRWDTATRVLDGDLRPVLFSSCPNCNFPLALGAIAHNGSDRVGCIHEQIQNHLVEFTEVARDQADRVGK